MTTTEQPHEEPSIPSEETSHGSSISDAIFNFSNTIIGAGAIGLGGAFAQSGGLISVFCIVFFAVLTKLSLDLVIRLSLLVQESSPNHHQCSYEDLGRIAYGRLGQLVVLGSKFLYSFGCLIAYIIVVKDNFGPAIKSLIYGEGASDSFFFHLLGHDKVVTWAVSAAVILPLCLLREASALARFSIVSVVSMVFIVVIIVYLYVSDPQHEIRQHGGSFDEHWLQVRPGLVENLGTFVFTFVSQHTVHLTFESLRPELRTMKNWERVSTWSLAIAGTVSLLIGLFVYMSFWDKTKSDIFQIYPAIPSIDLAKLLLCVSMLLTFPLPFFTCRELIVVFFIMFAEICHEIHNRTLFETSDANNDLQEPLLPTTENEADEENATPTNANNNNNDTEPSSFLSRSIETVTTFLIPGDESSHQLVLHYHLILSAKLWFVVTGLAVEAPSLGDVLDLVGCFSGTIIAFIFPALLTFRLRGFSLIGVLILAVGGTVGVVGTSYSVKKLLADVGFG